MTLQEAEKALTDFDVGDDKSYTIKGGDFGTFKLEGGRLSIILAERRATLNEEAIKKFAYASGARCDKEPISARLVSQTYTARQRERRHLLERPGEEARFRCSRQRRPAEITQGQTELAIPSSVFSMAENHSESSAPARCRHDTRIYGETPSHPLRSALTRWRDGIIGGCQVLLPAIFIPSALPAVR